MSVVILAGYLFINNVCVAEVAQTYSEAAQTTVDLIQTATKEPTNWVAIVLKFVFSILGVVLASVIIYLGLNYYNKNIVMNSGDVPDENSTLNTPKSTKEAVLFFIKQNKIN